MSFFKKLGTPVSAALVDAGDMAVKSPAPVLPPDAPKSDPALAAAPVEGFTAVPPPRRQLLADEKEVKTDLQKFDEAVERIEAQKKAKEVMIAANAAAEPGEDPPAPVKRGRGRPPGAKNKPKEAAPVVETEQVAAPVVGVTVKSVTVSKGFTVNLGAFNNVRFEVSVTGEGSDLELVYSTLMGEIEERLESEAKKYEAEVDQKNKTMKPANEVVTK